MDLYQQPYDPLIPLVCMDEKPVQLLKEKREPIPAKAGKPEREDYEYERGGVANVFLFTEPLVGECHLNIREQRTSVDWANEIKTLLDAHYPYAKRVCLVCDNLNTHDLRIPVQNISGRGSEKTRQETRDSLHTETWKLA